MSIQQKLWVALSWFVMLFAIALIANYTYFSIMPFSHWIRYDSVDPAKNTFKVGEQLEFISTTLTQRRCNLEFNDILYCRNGLPNSFKFYADYNSSHDNCKPSKERKQTTWKYGHAVAEPNTCYLESNITLKLPWGINKTYSYKGKAFTVIE